jgi:hypothetical protein
MKLIEDEVTDEVTDEVDDLESDEPEPVGKCLHLNPLEFTFSTGETIYKCVDLRCTRFDKKRREILCG